jgi:hypothetical protein
MKVLYWDDFDCTEETRRIAHPDTIHVHSNDERELAVAFLEYAAQAGQLWKQGIRYHWFRGPRGLVRDVEP